MIEPEKVEAIKQQAESIVQKFGDQYEDTGLLKSYAEFSLGFAALAGVEDDKSFFEILGESAAVASFGAGPNKEDWAAAIARFRGDEALTATILEAQGVIGGQYGDSSE